MATESSVVVALREVRRLELERQRREEEARVRQAQEDAEAARRSSIQYGQELSHTNGWTAGDGTPESYVQPMRRTSEVVPLGGRANGFHEPHPYVNVPGPTTWEAPPMVQTSKSGAVFKTFFVTVLLCAGGAAFGYYKLNQKFETEKLALTTERKMAEEARNEGVAAKSKTEQELKLQITQLEAKLQAANARAGAASAALNQAVASANSVKAAAPLPGGKAPRGGLVKGRAGRLAAMKARAAAAAKAEPVPPAPPAAKPPKVAKKKNVSDDPLGGLRL